MTFTFWHTLDSGGYDGVAGTRAAHAAVSEEWRPLFLFSSPAVYGWVSDRSNCKARFIGLPGLLELKRERKPDESGSYLFSTSSQP